MNHGCQIEVLAEFFRSCYEFEVIDAIDVLLDADDFLHYIDALDIFALSRSERTFF